MADFAKMEQIRSRVDEIVRDPVTAAALKPWYRQFCKRPCFHDEYLQTYNRPNVTLVDTGGRGVERLTREAVVVDGVEYPVDCLIFATGFEVGTAYTRRAGYEIVGRDGAKLTEHWKDGPRTLHGMTSHGFPNCFFMGFTQSALTVSVPQALNEQANHIVHLVGEAKARGRPTLEPTAAGEEGYVQEVRSLARLGETFYRECTPGYYNSEGEAGNRAGFMTDMYGAGPIVFFDKLAAWRAEGSLDGIELR
jgi:cyclohexanone monooxygenase